MEFIKFRILQPVKQSGVYKVFQEGVVGGEQQVFLEVPLKKLLEQFSIIEGDLVEFERGGTYFYFTFWMDNQTLQYEGPFSS